MAAPAPLRLGIVGSGRMARRRAANIAASPRARLVAVAARNPETGRALAAEHGCAAVASIAQLLERDDLDAVVVCTHNDSHGRMALAALDAGRHALVDYPLALEPAEAEAALASARRHGLALMVAYDQLWLGPHELLRSAIERAGPPRTVSVQVAWSGGPAESAFRNVRTGGPPALVKSYYLFALLDWLGLPERSDRTVRYRGLRPDGHFEAAVERIRLAYPGTLAEVRWAVGRPEAETGARVELTWNEMALVSDGRSIVRRDAAGETRPGVAAATWERATLGGLERFIDAALDRAPPRPDPGLAAAVVRIAAAGGNPGGHGRARTQSSTKRGQRR